MNSSTTHPSTSTGLPAEADPSTLNKAKSQILLPMDRFSFWVNSILVGIDKL